MHIYGNSSRMDSYQKRKAETGRMENENTSIKRIIILGTSGSGKTTLGKKLAELSGYPATDLDDLFWLPDWTPRSEEEMMNLVKGVAKQERWIISGNYSRSQHLTWHKADLLIWLDYPLRSLIWRSLKRSLRRIITKEPCCNGNYETLGRLFSKNSIVCWIFSSYHRRKKAYTKLLKDSDNHDLNIVRITNRTEHFSLLHNIQKNIERDISKNNERCNRALS